MNTEADLDAIIYGLHCLQREFDYHRAIVVAAETGLDDCLELYDSNGLGGDPEALGHIASWAHRLSMAMLSSAEVSNRISAQARILAEISTPRDPSTQEN